MNINNVYILKNNIRFCNCLSAFIKLYVVFVFAVFFLSCSSDKALKKVVNNDNNKVNESVTANFNEALGEMLEEVASAIDVEIDPDHYDYEKAGVSLSFTAKNSLFDRFRVGIKFIQLVNMEGYVFTLYDYNLTRHAIPVDFSQLNKLSQLLLYQENVPIGGYQSLVIEFDFNDVDIKAWVDNQLQKIYLVSDDARTFSIDQFSYRISVDLSTTPLILANNSYQHINVNLDLDQSILKVKPLDNFLPPGMPSSSMIFHPSLAVDLSMEGRNYFIDGKFQSINDRHVQFIPLGFMNTERYQSYFKPLQFFINDQTEFYINNKNENLIQSNILLAPENDGYVRLKGIIHDDEDDGPRFSIDELIYAGANDFDNHRIGRIHTVQDSTVTLSSRAFDLEEYTESSMLGTVNISKVTEVHTINNLAESRSVTGFMVPFQKLSVLSEEKTILSTFYLHPGYVSGRIQSISGETIKLSVMSVNHLSMPGFSHPLAIDINLPEQGTLAIGDHAVFTGYFYNDQFLALSFKKYPANNTSLMIWLDEMPPNEALTNVFKDKTSLPSIALTENITTKSAITYKRHDYLSQDSAVQVNNIILDKTKQYFLESYTTLNPHISKFNSIDELLAAISGLLDNGGKIYSILYRGKLSGSELMADSEQPNYFKVRFRGRWIDSELARSIFDEDYHGEKRLGGLTLEQLAAITGSVAALLLIEFILEKNKLGPVSQLRAPDFCKPSKKGNTGGKSSPSKSEGTTMKQKLSSGASAISSIGGIAQCLKKLASFSDSEMDIYKHGKQINPGVLSFDSENNKYSSLAVLGNKKLSKKGIEAFRTPEGQEKLTRILDTSQNLKKVFDRKMGTLGTFRTSAREAVFNLRVDLNKKARMDHDLFTRLTELDTNIQKPIIDMISDPNNDQDSVAVKKMITELSNLQDDKKVTLSKMRDVVNKANLGITIDIPDDKLGDRPLSPARLHDSNIDSLRKLEKYYAKFQLEPTSITNVEKLSAALGVSAFSSPQSFTPDKIEQAIDNYRKSIYTDHENINIAHARVLDMLYNNDYFDPDDGDKFYDAKTTQLVERRLVEIVKEKIIEAGTSGKKISTAALTEEFSQARKDLLRAKVKVSVDPDIDPSIDFDAINNEANTNVDNNRNLVDKLIDLDTGSRFNIDNMQNNKGTKGTKGKR